MPWTTVLACPHQNKIEMIPLSSTGACRFVPRATVVPRPLQNSEMPPRRSSTVGVLIPRAAVFPRPRQKFEMAPFSSPDTRRFAPRAAIYSRPPKYGQVPSSGSPSAGSLISQGQPFSCPHASVAKCPPLSDFSLIDLAFEELLSRA